MGRKCCTSKYRELGKLPGLPVVWYDICAECVVDILGWRCAEDEASRERMYELDETTELVLSIMTP